MATTHALMDWLNATNDTIGEHLGPMLGVEHLVDSHRMDLINDSDIDAIMGSYLLLNCANTHSIKVSFLSSEDVLMQIAKKILGLSPTDELSRDDMIDAIKEVINIISGGVKSRLNHQVSGGIALGLPFFVDKTDDFPKSEDTLFGKIIISGMPIYLSVSNAAHVHSS